MNLSYEKGALCIAIGIIQNQAQQYLITQRITGHLKHFWEFPGGKVEAGESPEETLQRELYEEVGITPTHYSLFKQFIWHYDIPIQIYCFLVKSYAGTVRAKENQPLQWRTLDTFPPMPPANTVICDTLKLPAVFQIITPHIDPQKVRHYLNTTQGKLLRLRHFQAAEAQNIVHLAECRMHKIIVDFDTGVSNAYGYHLNSQQLLSCENPLPCFAGASVHNQEQMEKAIALKLNYALVSPIQTTPTHADAQPLGWKGLQTIAGNRPILSYALGGMALSDMPTAQQHGADGIAGITLNQQLMQ